MRYTVPLVPQKYRMSCWAASIAMICRWRRGAEAGLLDDDGVADVANYRAALATGLMPNDTHPLSVWEFKWDYPQSYSLDGIRSLLQVHGPLWFAADVQAGAGVAPHIRVITGVEGDDVLINDPGPVGRGSQYRSRYGAVANQNTDLGAAELNWNRPIYMAYMSY